MSEDEYELSVPRLPRTLLEKFLGFFGKKFYTITRYRLKPSKEIQAKVKENKGFDAHMLACIEEENKFPW